MKRREIILRNLSVLWALAAGGAAARGAPDGAEAVPGREDRGQDVPLHGRFETEARNGKAYSNPFQDVSLDAVFTSPSGREVRCFGFHDGDGEGGQRGSVWKLRFMPDEVGPWSFTSSFSDGAPGMAGRFRCVAGGARPGPLRVDPAHPRHWFFAGGTRFLPRAYTAPELFVAANEDHRRHWIARFFGGKHRFNLSNANLLNFVAAGEVLNWQGTPYRAPDPSGEGRFVTIPGNGLFPFLHSGPRPLFDGGSNGDWTRPSIACWRNADEVLGELEERKAIWFNHWGMIGWEWSGNGKLLVPPAARKPALRYWIARLAPWWNVTWNLAGEWDELLTPAELDELGELVKRIDPWRHPLTSHSLGTTPDRPWVDFRVEQIAAGMSGDPLANAERARADFTGKPVFAFETFWEAVPGKLTADQVRVGAWGSVMGGASYLYAECFEPSLTWGDGAAFRFVEALHDVLESLRYWELSPRSALVNPGSLCLADPGRVYPSTARAGGGSSWTSPPAGGRSTWSGSIRAPGSAGDEAPSREAPVKPSTALARATGCSTSPTSPCCPGRPILPALSIRRTPATSAFEGSWPSSSLPESTTARSSTWTSTAPPTSMSWPPTGSTTRGCSRGRTARSPAPSGSPTTPSRRLPAGTPVPVRGAPSPAPLTGVGNSI